jgi:acetyltransferase-like isoleucine patch superfamily enzyme
MLFEDPVKNIRIVADQIELGRSVSFGENIQVTLKGTFRLGDFSRLGSDVRMSGNNVSIGRHFYNTSGLRVGGGGAQNPTSNLTIGDRCVIHNSFINVCETVEIGDDVGFSNGVDIITHGFWLSVLEGFPASFAGVRVGNGVIVGYKTIILMGVEMAENVVVGANSVVSRSLPKKGVYAGTPARFIRDIVPLDDAERRRKVAEILDQYLPVARYHGIEPKIRTDYPWVSCKSFRFNVETFEYEGSEDEETDDLRDYMRKWGIRIYTERPFKSRFSFTG